MTAGILVPLEVLGLGIVISYGIAVMIKLLLELIRLFSGNNQKNSN